MDKNLITSLIIIVLPVTAAEEKMLLIFWVKVQIRCQVFQIETKPSDSPAAGKALGRGVKSGEWGVVVVVVGLSRLSLRCC